MKKVLFIICLIFLTGNLTIVHSQARTAANNSVADKMFTFPAASVRLGGYMGEKINDIISIRIKKQDVGELIEPFRHQTETHLWQSEFWGKWIMSAIASYEYNHDREMLQIINDAVSKLLETQLPSGYMGNYADSARLQQWDIWGRKYTLLGLLSYYDLTGDSKALAASCKLADNLMGETGPGKVNIVVTGNYRGMPSCSILEPMVYLYSRTGDTKYLEFAKYIVAQWETPEGPRLISSALTGISVYERFAHPAVWWSYENGQKAYEMMSCYEGLLELYRITGEPTYLKAVKMAVNNIIANEINVAGSGTSFECFYHGAIYQTYPAYHTMETCVTMTWMKLCMNLLKLTRDPVYADQIEISAYNALLASVKYDASEIAKYSPLGGIRHAGEEQCGMNINCCSANGPRAFMMLPRFAVMGEEKEIVINMYGTLRTNIPMGKEDTVHIEQTSGYPATDSSSMKISLRKPENFTLSLRIPKWSDNTEITVNGHKEDGVISGAYKRITRVWKNSDVVIIKFDLTGRLITLNGSQAILRGPIVLARDTRFADGIIYEPGVVKNYNGKVTLTPSGEKPGNIWMAFTAPIVMGTDLEGEFGNPVNVHLCDFASAGNTWNEDSRYLVWIPRTLNVMNADYKPY